MTRFAKHKKAKKSIGEDATPWEELKETVNEEDKRKEEKRLEKKTKTSIKKDLLSMSNTWTFNE